MFSYRIPANVTGWLRVIVDDGEPLVNFTRTINPNPNSKE